MGLVAGYNAGGGSVMASVLLIEDEALIRMMIADMLVELGHSVAGEANDVQRGLLLASAAWR